MTFEQFQQNIKSLGYKVSEAEFPKAKGQGYEIKPPFICFLKSTDNTIWADGKPVYTHVRLNVEVYTERNDNTSCQSVESWFAENGIAYKQAERAWISSEKFYVTIYEVTLL